MVSEDFSFPKMSYQLPNMAVTPWLWRISSTVYPADYYEGEAAADDQRSECEEKMDMLWEDFNEELQRVCSLKDKKTKEAAAVAPVKLSNDPSAARVKMVELYCMQATESGMIRDKRSSKAALLVMKFLKKLFSITTTHQIKNN